MERDIKNILRDLEDKRNNDIIYKKNKLEEIFKSDPDIMEVLGTKEKRPLNKFSDPPTEEELEKRKEIEDYNERITHRQIVPFLKLNGMNKEVVNFIMFDIEDYSVSYSNEIIKNQNITVMCLVHEDDMDTPYQIQRTDLLSYIVRDLLCWSNVLGVKLKLTYDHPDIIDGKYYCRTMRFTSQAPNVVGGHMGMHNIYDRF